MMVSVLTALVDDFEHGRLETGGQFVRDGLGDTHGLGTPARFGCEDVVFS